MSETGVLQTLIVGHLWQSVAVAAVLAGALILGRKMRGTTRYGLAAAAFAASLALPLAAFIPGQALSTILLKKLGAPANVVEKSEKAPVAPSVLQEAVANNQVPAWIANLAPQSVEAVIPPGAAPSESPIGKIAIDNGAPKWAIDLGGNYLRSVVQPAPPPAKKPLFTLPQFKLPTLNLPDLTLPLLMVWAAGVLILLIRIGRDLIAVERLVARARPADLPDALKQRMGGVRVAVSSEAPGPMAAGLFRPCVVLPERIALASPGIAALLEHERAHIQRRDMLAALAQRIVLALLWWSPALYWISRRLDEEREVACDEAAVERTGDARAFARSLTSQAENQLWARAPRLAVGAIGPRSQFGRRIRRLIDLAKSGGSPARYSGRLAFAGLALAVATAAMFTPRFSADAQPTPGKPPSVEQSLAGGPIDPVQPRDTRDQDQRSQDRDQARIDRDPARGALWSRDDHDLDGGTDEALNQDIGDLLKDISVELKDSFAGLSPDLENELQGLSTEMAALGVEISAAVNQQVAAQMPEIMAELRQALAAEGIDIDDLDHVKFSGEDREQLREALEQARDQIHDQLGPEMREEIRQAIEDARREIAEHRDEIAAAAEQSRSGMKIAREAMAQARAEIDAARARGDFDKFKNYKWNGDKFDFNFDFGQIDKDVAAKLKAKGIDIDGRKTIRVSGTPEARLRRAAAGCDEKEVSHLIVDEKADVNGAEPGGTPPLIAAARAGCEDTVRALINANADVNRTAPGGGSALYYAVIAGNDDMARMLLRAGAKADKSAPGKGSPLVWAVHAGNDDIVRLLLDAGANANARPPGGNPVLVSAVMAGSEDIVKMLVEKGADVNASSHNGTPLSIAEMSGNSDMAAYLRSKGATAKSKSSN